MDTEIYKISNFVLILQRKKKYHTLEICPKAKMYIIHLSFENTYMGYLYNFDGCQPLSIITYPFFDREIIAHGPRNSFVFLCMFFLYKRDVWAHTNSLAQLQRPPTGSKAK